MRSLVSTSATKKRAMNLREQIENNLTVWLLSTLLAGFLAGIGAYKAIIEIAQLEVVSRQELHELRAEASQLDPGVASTGGHGQSIPITRGSSAILKSLNIAIKLDNDKAYDRVNRSFVAFFFYPKDPFVKITEDNRLDERAIGSARLSIEIGQMQRISLGELGVFEVTATNPKFSEYEGYAFIQSVEMKVLKIGA
jgi:hypothetical protein